MSEDVELPPTLESNRCRSPRQPPAARLNCSPFCSEGAALRRFWVQGHLNFRWRLIAVVMDPLSISSAIGGLVTVCGRTITTCRAIVSSIQDAPRILSSIQAECSTTREALSHIFMLINKSDTTALTHLSSNVLLSQSFDVALTGCTVTFSVLDNELDKVLKQSGSEGKLGFHQRAKFMWNEEVLKGAIEELRGQRDALNLLVMVVQRWVRAQYRFIDHLN